MSSPQSRVYTESRGSSSRSLCPALRRLFLTASRPVRTGLLAKPRRYDQSGRYRVGISQTLGASWRSPCDLEVEKPENAAMEVFAEGYKTVQAIVNPPAERISLELPPALQDRECQNARAQEQGGDGKQYRWAGERRTAATR
jgi:hypothetical protein